MIKKRKTFLVKGLSLIFWIILWQIIAGKINQELLLASPMAVLKQTVVSAFERNFWERIFFSYFQVFSLQYLQELYLQYCRIILRQ